MESFFRIRNNFTFTTCWGILEGQQLTYYDSSYPQNPSSASVKGVFFTKSAKVSKVSDRLTGMNHGICVVNDKSKLTFDCMDAAVCSVWFSSILRSTTSHLDADEQLTQLAKHRKVLGLDNIETYSKADIAKAYKKLCLKEHPDKGGSVEVFNTIKEAYNALNALQTVIDEVNSSQKIQYEAMIEKVKGTGIGLIVAEDKIRKHVLVTRHDENIKIVGLTEEAEGEIRPGDALIGIDEDDCSAWHLSRVRARLNEQRVPIGTVVHFTFERLIPVSCVDSPKPDDDDNCSTPGTPARGNSASTTSRKEVPVESTARPSSASMKDSVFRVFPSVDETENKSTGPSPFDGSSKDSAEQDKDTISLQKHKTVTDQLKSVNSQLQKEINSLREENDRMRQELTDQHDRQVYQLNEKLVGAYRDIKSMATEIATLRYQLGARGNR